MEIVEEEFNEIKRLMKLRIVHPQDVESIQKIVNKYIDPKMYLCRNCPAQIRAAHKRLTKWVEKNNLTIAETTEIEVITLDGDTEVSEPVKKGRPCKDCKKKKDVINT
jgi:hypothetical protein